MWMRSWAMWALAGAAAWVAACSSVDDGSDNDGGTDVDTVMASDSGDTATTDSGTHGGTGDSDTVPQTAKECTYGGQAYAIGESFPADDGCNTCSCMAGGAVACTAMACSPQDTCASHTDETSCAEDTDCRPVKGSPINAAASCLDPPQFTHCLGATMGCGDAITIVPDWNGTCWYFTDTCVPPGWPPSSGQLVGPMPPDTDTGSADIAIPAFSCDNWNGVDLSTCIF